MRPSGVQGIPIAMGDWVISSQGASNTGAPVASFPGWGSAVPTTLVPGTPQSLLLVALPTAAAATGQPTIGNVEIAAVHGKVSFGAVTAGFYSVGCAIYVCELNSTSTTWSVRDPLNTADANRDDYLYLDTKFGPVPLAATNVIGEFGFTLAIPRPIRIGGGQALALTVNAVGAAGNLDFQIYARSFVRRAS